MLKKIISGGQSGADRAALDAALLAGFPCGGSCPKGRLAEDGPIDEKYPVMEIEGGYEARTEENVLQSDGTLIFFQSEILEGTQLTGELCILHQKPLLKLDISRHSMKSAQSQIREFIKEHNIEILNVAGPRASECENIYDYTRQVIRSMLTP